MKLGLHTADCIVLRQIAVLLGAAEGHAEAPAAACAPVLSTQATLRLEWP